MSVHKLTILYYDGDIWTHMYVCLVQDQNKLLLYLRAL